jgi:hypothetical protein
MIIIAMTITVMTMTTTTIVRNVNIFYSVIILLLAKPKLSYKLEISRTWLIRASIKRRLKSIKHE